MAFWKRKREPLDPDRFACGSCKGDVLSRVDWRVYGALFDPAKFLGMFILNVDCECGEMSQVCGLCNGKELKLAVNLV